MYIFRISITKLSGGNSKKGTDLHTKGMYMWDQKEHSIAGSAAENRSNEEDLSLCLSMPPSGSKNICHGVQRRDNRNKVLHSYNEVLAGEPSIAH